MGSWFPLIPLKVVPLKAGGDTNDPGLRFHSENSSACFYRTFSLFFGAAETDRRAPPHQMATLVASWREPMDPSAHPASVPTGKIPDRHTNNRRSRAMSRVDRVSWSGSRCRSCIGIRRGGRRPKPR